MLEALMEKNRRTQQVLEHEKKDRETEKREFSKQISAMCVAIEQQQTLLAADQQKFKDELTQVMTKRVECGVPSEVKNEPPGLYKGGDDRRLGAKREQTVEGTDNNGPKGKCLPSETDSQTTEGVEAEEVINPYLINWDEWVKWYGLGLVATN